MSDTIDFRHSEDGIPNQETLSKLIDYLTKLPGSVDIENQYFEDLMEWYFKPDKNGISIIPNEDFRNNLLKLREIREIYHKGIPFVRNYTKGHKKGHTMLWYHTLERMIEEGNIREIKREERLILNLTKANRDIRTYYRHKRIINDLIYG